MACRSQRSETFLRSTPGVSLILSAAHNMCSSTIKGNRRTVDADRAGIHVVEALQQRHAELAEQKPSDAELPLIHLQQRHDRGLARAGLADERARLAAGEDEVETLKERHVGPRRVAEAHRLEPELAGPARRHLRPPAGSDPALRGDAIAERCQSTREHSGSARDCSIL
jgi:hypothetical protein